MGGKRQPGRYPVDGKMLTVAEIAEMIGSTKYGVHMRMSRLGLKRYQTLVDMYRANAFGNAKDKCYRYMVDGRWMTTGEIAEMLGLNRHTLVNFRCRTRCTMHEAIEHYREKGKNWRVPAKLHRVNGEFMTVGQASKRYGISTNYLYHTMEQRGVTLQAAVKRHEAWKARQAEREILEILGYGEQGHE